MTEILIVDKRKRNKFKTIEFINTTSFVIFSVIIVLGITLFSYLTLPIKLLGALLMILNMVVYIFVSVVYRRVLGEYDMIRYHINYIIQKIN